MSLKDSFLKYGAEFIPISVDAVVDSGKMVMNYLQARRQRPVASLAVAALLIQMHADVVGVDTEETIELVRTFIKTLDLSQRPKA